MKEIYLFYSLGKSLEIFFKYYVGNRSTSVCRDLDIQNVVIKRGVLGEIIYTK